MSGNLWPVPDPVNVAKVRDALIHALTRYDAKQSGKRGYNPNALGIYFARVDDICADITNGASVRAAIVAGMVGRLQDVALRAVGEPIGTNAECTGSGKPVYYVPASATP